MSARNAVPEGTYAAIISPMKPVNYENPEHAEYMERHYGDVLEEDRPDRLINYEAVDDLLEYVAEGGVDGVVPAGCTGHGPSLRTPEHVEYVERVAEMARNYDLDVIAGDGMNTTWETKHLAGQIDERADVDAHMMISPYVNKPEQDGLIRHYTEAAERVDAPVIMYTVPSRTGSDIAPETTAELAAHPNIVGIKEASGDLAKIAETAEIVDERGIDDFAIGSGNDFQNYGIFTQAMERDIPSFAISVAAIDDPESVAEEYSAAADGDYRQARETNHARRDLDNSHFVETNPIPVQEAMNRLGIDAGTPREPLGQRPREETQNALEEAMREEGLL